MFELRAALLCVIPSLLACTSGVSSRAPAVSTLTVLKEAWARCGPSDEVCSEDALARMEKMLREMVRLSTRDADDGFPPQYAVSCLGIANSDNGLPICSGVHGADDSAHLTEFPPYSVIEMIGSERFTVTPRNETAPMRLREVKAWPVKDHHQTRPRITALRSFSNGGYSLEGLTPHELHTLSAVFQDESGAFIKYVWLVRRL